MSCKNFETVITEIARGQMLEAGARAHTLAHVEECKSCASRLADEQALTAGLRTVASTGSSTLPAPARVEAALVTAFRRRTELPARPAAAQAYRTLSRWATLGIAAAAALLVVSALTVSRLLFVSSDQPAETRAGVEKTAPVSAPAIASQEPKQTLPETISEPSPVPDIGHRPAPTMAAQRPFDKARGLMRNVSLGNKPVGNPGNAANAGEEITTEFLPLTYGGLSQIDEGQVIRIEVPRSALQSFGLPVNVERAGERVKADVLLGHDGVARAIRFVR
ncbi:MAG TPA: hypothetical protein VEV81_12590 [Pyrinomonadaceae bacterium]|nr:hypothetical protein [Pyrinomonadaceae bacterium]